MVAAAWLWKNFVFVIHKFSTMPSEFQQSNHIFDSARIFNEFVLKVPYCSTFDLELLQTSIIIAANLKDSSIIYILPRLER